MRLLFFTLLLALNFLCITYTYCSEPRWLLVRDIQSPDATLREFGMTVSMHSGVGLASGFRIGAGSFYGAVYSFPLEGSAHPQELYPIGTPPNYNDFVYTAISENRILVGDDEDPHDTTGAAYLFDRTTGQQIARLTAPDGQDGRDYWFGYDVALTTDYAVVTSGNFPQNAAYVFDARDGQFIRKIAETGPYPSISVDTYRNFALFGGGSYYEEKAYLYDLDTGEHLQSFANPNPLQDDEFGLYVALNENYAAVSSRHRGSANGGGTVSVFEISSGDLVAQYEGNARQNNTLDISGNLLIIGAPNSPSIRTKILNLNTFQFLPDLPHAETVAIDGKFVLLGRGDRVQVYRLVPESATQVFLLLPLTSAVICRRRNINAIFHFAS